MEQQQLVAHNAEVSLRGAPNSPISLFLSPKISPERGSALREIALARPRYARIVDSEEGAISVLPDFELSEISALERRRCRIIGLAFAERLLRDPSSLEKVNALPLYDFILPPESTVCHSGLPAPVKLRCSVLAGWMGARISEKLDFDMGLLVAARVSLHPSSKYQEALTRNVPIVRPAYLEAAWDAKERISIEQHALPALSGLGVCFDPRHADIIDKYRGKLAEHGAVMEALNRAEVVIVKDVFAPLYEDAKKIGILCAPPLWLDRCFQLRRCVPICGELEVPNMQSSALVAPGQSLGSFGDFGTFQRECNGALLGSVLCLLYLSPGHDRNYAKALAWKCGAFTTLDPLDRAITHVLFKVVSKISINVSIPEDEDRVSFLDIAWLEACVRAGRRSPEHTYAQQLVNYNPACDSAHAAILGRSISSTATSILGHARPNRVTATLQMRPSDAPAPLADAAPSKPVVSVVAKPTVSMPTSDKGVFAGMRLAVYSGQSAPDAESTRVLAEKLCSHGATVVRGSPEALLESRPNWCICCDAFAPPSILQQSSLKLTTISWVNACIIDGMLHSRTSFPHFNPCAGTLPIPDMSTCAIRLTAVGGAHDAAQSNRKRALLEEVAQLLGATVVDQKAKWSEITHMVCVVPELVDIKQYESSCKRNKHMVTLKWLFDCFYMYSRQPEENYCIKTPQLMVPDSPGMQMQTPIPKQRSLAVLASFQIFISPSSFGSDDKLPCRAEDLGAEVHTWRSADELQAALASCGILPSNGNGDEPESLASGSSKGGHDQKIVVLVEKEEVSSAGSPLAAFIAALPATRRGIFVLPTWLAETFSQRRSLPLEAFSALPAPDAEGQAPKRQRTSSEAQYAWQPAASKSLTEMAEESRARALQSKQQQKVSEGLRLADLRREGPTGSARA